MAIPPSMLSRQLRRSRSPRLRRRRGIVGLGLLAAGSMGVITLYQMGLIRHLPEPPLPGFDGDRVDASDEAYSHFEMPDAPIGLLSYAVTIALAASGSADRSRTRPWLPIALAAKAAIDALQAGKLTWDQWAKHRAFCSWCLLAAGATFAALPLTIPEARDAIDRLLERNA